MAYVLEAFCDDCRGFLKSGRPLDEILPQMAEKLGRLLENDAFVAQTFKSEDDFSKKILFHDDETDFYVMAHVHQGPKEGSPHNHGASWAIYGTAMGVTGMKEWDRLNPQGEEAARLAMRKQYELRRGQARGYAPHAIHSTIHPAKAWVVRVTGTNLDVLPRYRFKKGRDEIVQAASA
jgi:predicted metal-dependent enzyme (double-stranded beta helix superfamily)